jgi:hypothetical protein
MQTQGFILVQAKMSLRPVDVAAACVALHYSARVVGVTSIQEREQIPNLFGDV